MQKQQSQSQNENEEAEQQQNSQEGQEQQQLQEDQDEQQSLSATITYFETSPVQEVQQAQVEGGEHEEEQQEIFDDQEIERVHDKTLSSSISGERRGDGVLKGLERRYHLLYLKAIEVQCFFENIIERKKTPVSIPIFFILITIYLRNIYRNRIS